MRIPTFSRTKSHHPLQHLGLSKPTLRSGDIIPVATMFRSVPEVKEVDLSQNTLLTDKSLVPLLQKMKRNPACATLTRLSLRQCVRLREKAIQEIINLVESSSGLSNLKILDAGISIREMEIFSAF